MKKKRVGKGTFEEAVIPTRLDPIHNGLGTKVGAYLKEHCRR